MVAYAVANHTRDEGQYAFVPYKNISLPEVPPDNKLRKKLERENAEQLFKILEKLSPTRSKNIDKYNKVRLIRAIEIAKALGDVPAILEKPSKYDFAYIGLDLPDKKLKENINIRLYSRIKKGMVNEVKKLHTHGVSWKRLESFGLEYKNLALYLQNKISREQMEENIKNESWQYVKRQRTWFKRNKNITWFKPNKKSKVVTLTKQLLRK